MTDLAAAGGTLAATVSSAFGAVLYLAIAFFVLRLSVRWAREALGEAAGGAAVAEPGAPGRGSSPKPARG